jgi:adenylosuccinate lyase
MVHRATHDVIIPAIDDGITQLINMAEETKDLPMLGRTHGQAAVPTTLGKELAVFANRLNEQVKILASIRLKAKTNGAVGNHNAHVFTFPETDWISFSKRFITSFGLEPVEITNQIAPYDDLAELFQGYIRINGIYLDLVHDMWRYISDGWFNQNVVSGEVGSSTMPQKVNPIDFENAEGNAGLSTAILEFFARKLASSRLQRDLSDSTVIRNQGVAIGYTLLVLTSTLRGLKKVIPDTDRISKALNKDYAILTEPVQTILKTIPGIEDPYNLIKGLSRGVRLTADDWKTWVEDLPNSIPAEIKERLAKLTPEKYIGEAITRTETAITDIRSSVSARSNLQGN